MTETSFFWDGIVTGDALLAPYSATEFRNIWKAILLYDPTEQGIIAGVGTYSEALRISLPTPTRIDIGSGNALINGNFYHYDASSFTFSTPASGSYYYTLVLRQNKPGKTVRLIMLGPSTSSYPSATQTSDIWEVVVGKFTIGPAGMSYQIQPSKHVIANDMTVPIFPKRQGGDASSWDVQGTTNYSLAHEIRMEAGTKVWTGSATSGNVAVTFPVQFAQSPLVFISPTNGLTVRSIQIGVESISATGFTIYWRSEDGHTETSLSFYWMAIGSKLVS